MTDFEDWSAVLDGHPIFSVKKVEDGLKLSSGKIDTKDNGQTPSGRRQVMVLKDADLILAVGREIRITSLGDSKLTKGTGKSYKVLHTPNLQFEVHQLALNPTGKLLAVAGAFQVAVVVLPRPGFMRLVPATVDCKSIQVGQFYHASKSSAPIAKIEWHPWGDAGSTLLIMTVDGKLREYDISMDTEEPQQVLAFVPDRKTKSFNAEDTSEREVTSFTLGKGKADWGPLTVYAVVRSGDVYAMCPYLPKNASIPSAYVHALECFISAKQEFLAQGTSVATKVLSTLYDYQHKYITALLKQLPAGTAFPAASRSVVMHPPTTIKSQPLRQGPFLLQPAPRTLEGSDGGDATDIAYLGFVTDDDEEGDGETERLGVILLSYQDGKVDVCLDVEKVEARWETSQNSNRDLPMIAVYETIDLGFISMLGSSPLSLLQQNHPVFLPDSIHDDTVYVYHAFGVHTLHLGPVLQSLAVALRTDEDDLNNALQRSHASGVHPILTTFSVERQCSNPIIGVCVPNDIYLTYSIFILTSAMRIFSFALNLRSHSSSVRPPKLTPDSYREDSSNGLPSINSPSVYVSLLESNPFTPSAVLSRPLGLPSNPRLALPGPPHNGGPPEFLLTPETLRYLGATVGSFTAQIHDVQLAHRAAVGRAALQMQELTRQQDKCREILAAVERLGGVRRVSAEGKLKQLQGTQKTLLGRLDRMLEALMQRASPDLSEHETRWFEELKRMKEEVKGTGRYDEGSLAARAALLKKEYDRLMPTLRALQEKENAGKKRLAETNQGLGFTQAFEFGERSNFERVRIGEIEKEVIRLGGKLEVPLGLPPSRR